MKKFKRIPKGVRNNLLQGEYKHHVASPERSPIPRRTFDALVDSHRDIIAVFELSDLSEANESVSLNFGQKFGGPVKMQKELLGSLVISRNWTPSAGVDEALAARVDCYEDWFRSIERPLNPVDAK